MTKESVGEISAKLTIDESDAVESLGKTDKALDKTDKKLDDNQKALKINAKGWAKWGAAAALAAGAAAAAITKQSLASIRELKILSQAANISIKDFQQMAFAANEYGVAQSDLEAILKDTNDRIGDFLITGAGPMADFFDEVAPRIGVTAEQFKNLSSKDALQLYVSSLEKANLNQAEMTFFMEQLSSESTRLLPLLRDNGKAMAQQAKAAKELGVGLSEVDAAKADDAQKSLDRLAGVIQGKLLQAAADLSPIVIEVAEAIETMLDWSTEQEKQLKNTTLAVEDQIAALKTMSDAQLNQANEQAIQQQKRVQEQIESQIKTIKDLEEEQKLMEQGSLDSAESFSFMANEIDAAKDALQELYQESAQVQRLMSAIFDERLAPKLPQEDSAAEERKSKRQKEADEEAAKLAEKLANERRMKQEAAQQDLLDLQMQFASESELADQWYLEQQDKLREALGIIGEIDENGRIISADGRAIELELFRQHQEEKTRIEQDEAEKRMEIARQEAVQKVDDAHFMATSILAANEIFGSKSEKQQKKNRKRQVKIDTAAGIGRAFAEHNFYEALGISAIILNNGMKQLAAIDSSSQPSPTSGAGAQSVASPQQSAPVQRLDVNFVGQRGGAIDDNQALAMVEAINRIAGDGVQINVNPIQG